MFCWKTETPEAMPWLSHCEPTLRQLNYSGVWLLQVCRSAGYFEHALFVAQAATETEWYLDILLEDLHAWDDALAYLQDLARQQAAAALKKHGKV